MIYLDNSATSFPKPQTVSDAFENALKVYGANPGRAGHKMAMETSEKIYEVRESTANFFNAPLPDCVAFTLNCTNALNYAIKGNIKKGDHVLTSDIEHNSVIRPLEKLKQEGLISYDIFETDPYNADKTLKNLLSKINKKTSLIVCTHASNVFGFLNPIERIGEICKKNGIIFIVDGAQSAGILPIDIQKCSIDFLCVPGHKGLYGPMGTGAIISNGKNPLTTVIEGGTGSASINTVQPPYMPDVFEAGTQNVPGIIALGEGIKFVKGHGIDEIYYHERKHILNIYNKIKNIPRVQTYTEYEQLEDFSPIISFNIEGTASEKTAEYLSENGIYTRAGLHCAPSAHKKIGTLNIGTVRISPSFFTTDNDIIYAIHLIKNAAEIF